MLRELVEIEESVKQLTNTDLAEFRQWFAEYLANVDAARWDEELERDANNGKLERMAASALAQFRAGRCEEM
jgi:hypothetical protein